jgi:hypothetical protein
LNNDQDCDVRIRACTLVYNLWILYNHEKHQSKKPSTHDDNNIFFHHINASELLVESAHDTNRVVRIEAYRVISNILSQYPSTDTQTAAGKRHLEEEEDEFATKFIDALRGIDMNRLKESLDPEHLYQEAFEINADMMTQSILPKNPEDDINMLDCE